MSSQNNLTPRPLKLCFVFPRFTGPYGSERHLMNLALCLAEKNYEVTIYTHKFHAMFGPLLSKKIRIVETGFLNVENHDIATFLDLLLMPNLALKVRGKHDLILAMKWQSALGVFLTKKFHKRYSRTPTVYHCNEPPRFIYDLIEATLSQVSYFKRFLIMFITPIVKYIDKYTVKKFDLIIANSDQTAGQIRKIYARDSQIVYPGIEIERFKRYGKKEARAKLKLSEDLKLFLSVSKLHRRKRIDKALKIYEEYSKNLEKSMFFIVGEGAEEQNLRQLVRTMNLKNVEFLGRISGEEVPLYYSAADYFIFTAKDEPFGIAPLEAKVSGCTILGIECPYPILSWKGSTERTVEVYRTASEGRHTLDKQGKVTQVGNI